MLLDRLLALLSAGALALTIAAFPSGAVHAQSSRSLELSGTGFLTAAAGKVLGGTHDPAADSGYECPCYIADYAQAGVHDSGRVRFGPDSKLGLQGRAAILDGRASVTGQIVSRGAANGNTRVEWVYGSFDLSSKLTLQVGRKRLPLFAYSEVQDVGFALPWIHLPPQLYGWEIVNYNGMNLQYRDAWGDWSGAVNLFGGYENARDAGYWKIYNGKDSRTDVRWTNIAGIEAKLARGPYEMRFVHVQSDMQNKAVSAGDEGFGERKHQKISGVGFTAEPGHWIVRAEFLSIDRTQDYGRDHAQLYAAGYRWGRFTPLVSYSNYRQKIYGDETLAEAHDTLSAVLRYDLDGSSAIKLQLDRWRDRSADNFASMRGNSRVVSVSYDKVF